MTDTPPVLYTTATDDDGVTTVYTNDPDYLPDPDDTDADVIVCVHTGT